MVILILPEILLLYFALKLIRFITTFTQTTERNYNFFYLGEEVNRDGFRIKLFGYQYRICLNFREVYDETGSYKKLFEHLNGKGVASIDEALLEMEMIPLHSALEEFLAPPNIRELRNYVFQSEGKEKTRKEKEESTNFTINTRWNVIFNE